MLLNTFLFKRKIQTNDYSCGAVSTWMLIENLIGSYPYSYVKSLVGTTREGSTVKGILYALRRTGISCSIYTRLTLTGLYNKLYSDSYTRYAIVHVDGDHFIVVTGMDDKYVYIADPAVNRTTKIRHTYSVFKKRWKGWAILGSTR